MEICRSCCKLFWGVFLNLGWFVSWMALIHPLSTISAILVAANFLPVCCCNEFIVEVWGGLKDLSWFVLLFVTLGYAIFIAGRVKRSFKVHDHTRVSNHLNWWLIFLGLCQEFIGIRIVLFIWHIPFLFSCYCTDLVLLGLLLGYPAPICVLVWYFLPLSPSPLYCI